MDQKSDERVGPSLARLRAERAAALEEQSSFHKDLLTEADWLDENGELFSSLDANHYIIQGLASILRLGNRILTELEQLNDSNQ